MPKIKTIHYPENYQALEKLRSEYVKRNCLLVSFEKIKKPSEAKKLKDYLVGITWARGGIVFKYKKFMLFSLLVKDNPKDIIKM